jgi:DNA-binding transcriptional regulator YiaG
MDGFFAMKEHYHYTGCGLDFVYLTNGYKAHQTPDGEGVAIEDADGLHKVIAREIITGPQRIRGQEVRFLRSEMDLSQEGLAKIMLTTRGTIARYEGSATKPIPGQAEAALRMFVALKIGGHEIAEQIVELLTEIDEFEHGDIAFSETQHGWVRMAA